MNPQKTGAFLKVLRKDKGLTQEQLAEHFYVSSRTVSRWETGSNMPDVDMLIELADFYDVDIREIIDGECKSENIDNKAKDLLKKVAVYAVEKEKGAQSKVTHIALGITLTVLICMILFADGTAGLLYGLVPEILCNHIRVLVYGIALCFLLFYLKAHWWQEKPSQEPERTTVATVLSKEVKRGTQQTGRSNGGYSYVIRFLTEDGLELELFAYEVEFGGLKEGTNGVLTYKGRYFVSFK